MEDAAKRLSQVAGVYYYFTVWTKADEFGSSILERKLHTSLQILVFALLAILLARF